MAEVKEKVLEDLRKIVKEAEDSIGRMEKDIKRLQEGNRFNRMELLLP